MPVDKEFVSEQEAPKFSQALAQEMAEHLARRLKEGGYGTRPISGQVQGDWVLVDAGDVIVHLFRPEVRDYYDLEGMWSVGTRK